jgi:hypothetical protein
VTIWQRELTIEAFIIALRIRVSIGVRRRRQGYLKNRGELVFASGLRTYPLSDCPGAARAMGAAL